MLIARNSNLISVQSWISWPTLAYGVLALGRGSCQGSASYEGQVALGIRVQYGELILCLRWIYDKDISP